MVFKGEKMKTIFVMFIILFFPARIFPQGDNETKTKDNNNVSLNVDIYFRDFKDASPLHLNTFALVVNYQRTIFTSGSFGMSGEVGIGIKYPHGSTEFMRIDKTANLFLNGDYFKGRHKINIGFGGVSSFQDGLWGAVKIRYTNFVEENKFVFVSFNQTVWYSAGQSNKDETNKYQSIWFWDSKANDFIVNLGDGPDFLENFAQRMVF